MTVAAATPATAATTKAAVAREIPPPVGVPGPLPVVRFATQREFSHVTFPGVAVTMSWSDL